MTNLENRRSFLKKAVYVAPIVLAMGPLAGTANARGSKVYTNQANSTSVKTGGNDTIVVAKKNGGTVTVKSNRKLSGFNQFLRRLF